MRKNLTKEKIRQGKIAFGVFVPLWSPSIVEIMGYLGFDYVIIDAEHSPVTPESCEHMVRAADCVNVTPIVRIAVNVRQNILRYLDTGALGVLMPQINTAAEAAEVVQAVKYPPVGKRGLASMRADSFGLTATLGEYVEVANRETLVITQVETVEAVANIKEIVHVPGVDMIFIGPNDLSSAMGYPGQKKHPEVQRTIEYLVKEIHGAGKAAGTVAYDLETLNLCKERGFEFITYNVIPMLKRAGEEYLKFARE